MNQTWGKFVSAHKASGSDSDRLYLWFRNPRGIISGWPIRYIIEQNGGEETYPKKFMDLFNQMFDHRSSPI